MAYTIINVSCATKERCRAIATRNKERGVKPDTIGGVADNIIEKEYARIKKSK